MAGLLGRRNSPQAKETRENRARVSPDEEGGYGYLSSAKALVKRSSPRGIEEAVWQQRSRLEVSRAGESSDHNHVLDGAGRCYPSNRSWEKLTFHASVYPT